MLINLEIAGAQICAQCQLYAVEITTAIEIQCRLHARQINWLFAHNNNIYN